MTELFRAMVEHYVEIEELFADGKFETRREEYRGLLQLVDDEAMRQFRIMANRTPSNSSE